MGESTSTDTRHGSSGSSHDDKGQGRRSFPVVIRTLAGHSRRETVKSTDTVGETTVDAVRRFVEKGELEPGGYALTLPRSTGDAELDPTATLQDAGVVENDVLVLVSRLPQVDG